MIILLILAILIIVILLICFTRIKFIIRNIKTTNYVKIKILFITIYYKYDEFLNTVKNIGINNNLKFTDVIKLLKNTNPFIKDIMNITKIDQVILIKYYDQYSENYQVITFYLLFSYINGYLNSNFKSVESFESNVIYSKDRKDLDFNIELNLSIFHTLIVMLKNINIFIKYIKRRNVYGS